MDEWVPLPGLCLPTSILSPLDIAALAGHTREVVVVVHNTGHGTQEYLDLLLADLKAAGFVPKTIGLG